ncbi:hypothetical protein C8R46DRAFT_996218 [Mycena filopes]|nr:hypothetical protein C8R46DRAFT_996218 [Mycena filopes]
MRHALGDLTNLDRDSPTKKQRKRKKATRRKRTKRARLERDSSDKEDDDDPKDSGSESDSESDRESGTDHTKAVESLGRRFVLSRGLWLTPGALEAELDDTYDEKKRFDGGEVQGQYRDILNIVPAHLRGDINTGWFQRAFRAGMGDQRSNTSTRIRRVAGTSIYDCAAGDLLTPTLREKFRQEIGWTGDEYASLDVPLLHEDGRAAYDIHTCFLSPVPMRLCVALIRGPSAADAMLKGVSVPKTDNMESIHGFDHSEPATIAASCTLAIWGKSIDVHLKSRGETTNIDYEARFNEYLEILTTGLRMKTPSILHVFSEWDRIVFPNAKASYVDPEPKKNSKSDGLRRAMAAMKAEAEGADSDQEEQEEQEEGMGSAPARAER